MIVDIETIKKHKNCQVLEESNQSLIAKCHNSYLIKEQGKNWTLISPFGKLNELSLGLKLEDLDADLISVGELQHRNSWSRVNEFVPTKEITMYYSPKKISQLSLPSLQSEITHLTKINKFNRDQVQKINLDKKKFEIIDNIGQKLSSHIETHLNKGLSTLCSHEPTYEKQWTQNDGEKLDVGLNIHCAIDKFDQKVTHILETNLDKSSVNDMGMNFINSYFLDTDIYLTQLDLYNFKMKKSLAHFTIYGNQSIEKIIDQIPTYELKLKKSLL